MKFKESKIKISRGNWQKAGVLLILLAIGLTLAAAPEAFSAQTEPTPKIQNLYETIQSLTCSEGAILGVCLSRTLTWIAFYILVFISALFQVFGNLFDLATAVSLAPETYNLEPIRTGWAIARDTANLFFIFVLLTISIATILQIDTYGAKKLLPNLIFAALFINFSFLLSQYVIYSSNLLTGFFLPGATDGAVSKNLSVKFLAGVNPNRMFASANFGNVFNEITKVQNRLQEVKQEIREEDATEEQILAGQAEETKLKNELTASLNSKEFLNTTIQLGIAILGTSVFILFAMFALAVAGLALLIRVVMLWFLMILSPIAFLFFVIPGLSGEARKWWDALLKQAFFAPGFFFLFGLTVEMISSGSAQALFRADQEYQGAFITSFTVIGYYTLLIIMLLASVAFAKTFGSYSGQWAFKGASVAKGYVQGYAGRVSRRYGGAAAGGVLESKPAQWLSRVPIARQALLPLAAAARTAEQQADEDAKRLKGLSPKAQASMLPTLTARSQASAFRSMKDEDAEKVMENFSEGEKVKFGQRMKQYNLERKAAVSSKSLKTAMQIMYDAPSDPPTPHDPAYLNSLNTFTSKLKPQQLANFDLREKGFAIHAPTAADPDHHDYIGNYLPDTLFKNLTGAAVSELIKKKDNAAALSQIMRDKAQSIGAVNPATGAIDRDALANHIQTNYQNVPFAKFIKTSMAALAIL